MKKLLILSLFLLCSVFSISSFADNSSVLDSLKAFIKNSLNSTVSIVKGDFNSVETDRKTLAEDVSDLDERVDIIKEQESSESDGSVLKHGKADFVKTCDYSKENLKWNGTKWDCVTAAPLSDCSANSGEYRVESPANSGNYKCSQRYTFSKELGEWSECNEDLGEKYAYEDCIYKNSLDSNMRYQVASSYCSGLAKKTEPCGKNSSCKCPAGLSLQYNSNNEVVGCEPDIGIVSIDSDMKYTFNNGVLQWGTIGDNYWKGMCGLFTKTLKFNYNPQVIKSVKLLTADFDDYLWLYVNGRYVWGGPDANMSDYSGTAYSYSSCTVVSGVHCVYGNLSPTIPDKSKNNSSHFIKDIKESDSYFYTKNGIPHACERNTSWHQEPNLDITRYLIENVNTIKIKVMVKDEGEGSVTFDFDLNKEEASSPICNETATWQEGSWSTCNKSCGGGTQTRSVTCPSGFTCSGPKPAISQSCNTQACTSSWQEGSWSTCNKSCGGGTQTRSVTCPLGFACLDPKPATSQSCNTQACTSSWQEGSWSTCNKSCGGGTQTRSVTCPLGFTCLDPKPATSQSCNTQACTECKCPFGTAPKYNSNNEIIGCQKKLTFTNPESDMEYTFENGKLTWGKMSTLWKGYPERFNRRLQFNADSGVVKSLKLTNLKYDDYLWMRVNGHYVYGGPDANIAEYMGPAYGGYYGNGQFRLSPDPKDGPFNKNYFYTKDGVSRLTERNKVWDRNPNLDLTRYLVDGSNTIEAQILVYDEGYMTITFDLETSTNTETSAPICGASGNVADWNVGNWSSCSKSCGGGIQSRNVTCPTGFTCVGAKPANRQSCNVQACVYNCAPDYYLRGTKCYKDECANNPTGSHGKCMYTGPAVDYCIANSRRNFNPIWNGQEVYATTEQNVPYNAFYIKGSYEKVASDSSYGPPCYFNCNMICKKGGISYDSVQDYR